MCVNDVLQPTTWLGPLPCPVLDVHAGAHLMRVDSIKRRAQRYVAMGLSKMWLAWNEIQEHGPFGAPAAQAALDTDEAATVPLMQRAAGEGEMGREAADAAALPPRAEVTVRA